MPHNSWQSLRKILQRKTRNFLVCYTDQAIKHVICVINVYLRYNFESRSRHDRIAGYPIANSDSQPVFAVSQILRID